MTHFFVQASDPGASILSYGKEIVWIEMMTIVITDLYDDQTRHFLSSLNAFIFFNTAMDCFIVILLISKLIL